MIVNHQVIGTQHYLEYQQHNYQHYQHVESIMLCNLFNQSDKILMSFCTASEDVQSTEERVQTKTLYSNISDYILYYFFAKWVALCWICFSQHWDFRGRLPECPDCCAACSNIRVLVGEKRDVTFKKSVL